MATTEYTIWAYSPTANQEVRELNLEMGNPPTKQLADQTAGAFAHRLNTQTHLKANDWVGRVKLEQLGIETLPNYQFHTGM